VVPSSLALRAGASGAVTVYAMRQDGFTNPIDLSLLDPPPGFKLSDARIAPGQDQARVTVIAPARAPDRPVVLRMQGRGQAGGEPLVRMAVPAEDMMQAFAYRHLVPATQWQVLVRGRGGRRPSAEVASTNPAAPKPAPPPQRGSNSVSRPGASPERDAERGLDWPCWRGPERDGNSRERGWTWKWGTNGPAVLWRASVGKGFSSFAVADGWVYTLGNSQDADTVWCLAADTGVVRWRHTYPCASQPLSYEGGPSATPAVDGQRLYSFSKDGHLICLETATGRVAWSKKFDPWPFREGDWRNTWRYASSPLVAGDRVFLGLGQAGAAFAKQDGATVWESPPGHPGYSSPVPFRAGEVPGLVFFSGRSVIGVRRATGTTLWEIPWKTLWDLNAADPVVHGDRVFVSSGNGVGCALFDVAVVPPRELWRNRNLKTTVNSAVLSQGHIYGFNDTHLACLSWETGAERWTTRDVRNGSLIVAADKLVLLSETGKLVVADATPDAYRHLAQAQILDGRCWTTPVLSHGRLLARNAAGDVVCLDLRTVAPR
jgi:hypothetical protein